VVRVHMTWRIGHIPKHNNSHTTLPRLLHSSTSCFTRALDSLSHGPPIGSQSHLLSHSYRHTRFHTFLCLFTCSPTPLMACLLICSFTYLPMHALGLLTRSHIIHLLFKKKKKNIQCRMK